MSNITAKFLQLKTSIGGNREKTSFEMTFGKTVEEKANITRPSRANIKTLAEQDYGYKTYNLS